jgi:hypothetical protein
MTDIHSTIADARLRAAEIYHAAALRSLHAKRKGLQCWSWQNSQLSQTYVSRAAPPEIGPGQQRLTAAVGADGSPNKPTFIHNPRCRVPDAAIVARHQTASCPTDPMAKRARPWILTHETTHTPQIPKGADSKRAF